MSFGINKFAMMIIKQILFSAIVIGQVLSYAPLLGLTKKEQEGYRH